MIEIVPRARTVRNGTDFANWEAVLAAPHASLCGAVAGDYQGWRESSIRTVRRREVPSGIVPLILNLGPPLLVAGPGEPAGSGRLLSSFAAGLHESFAITESGRLSYGVQVNLTPLGAYRVLGLPMHEIANRVLPLDDLLGADATRLVERLAETADWDERFALLDAFFARRLERARAPLPGVTWALRQIEQSRGQGGIGLLARDLGWSHKRLIARFRDQIGLPPKTVARILRFQRAVTLTRHAATGVAGPARVDWSALACDCGYFDQAHLIRDFGQFAGTTPAEFLRSCLPEGGGVLGD